ncbi:glycosyltransferase [Rhodopila globiformis]|uniref:Glycosyl transferase n=1 Tax=Rhodopila globiformis TaxID=1071 RepID=A0A2S6NKH3_RHOGL|nr:glycosyltransferase family 2 protein [Rhodopila globiformis]PPQ35475.1 glycosyl transferase [Rhodopila globiformis]
MLAIIALLLAAGPLLLALSNFRFYVAPPVAAGWQAVSVLIPARNEEATIGAACAAVLANRGVTLELIVLDDHSTDRTREILAGIDDPRLKVASAPPLPPGWSGKQHACAHLATLARHDLMVFVDADVRLAPDALSRMAGFMQRNDVGLASGFPRQIVRTWSEVLLLPLIHFLLLGFLPMALMRRSVNPAFGAGCGQLFIARRAAYLRAGGHAAIRASLHDGIKLPRAFRAAGIPTGLFDATDIAACRMYTNAHSLWEGLTKNATEGMATIKALPIWTGILAGGQILPPIVLVMEPGVASAGAVAASIGLRLLLARRLRQSIVSALLHPVGVAALLVVQWAALVRHALGVPATWRGRAYTVQ